MLESSEEEEIFDVLPDGSPIKAHYKGKHYKRRNPNYTYNAYGQRMIFAKPVSPKPDINAFMEPAGIEDYLQQENEEANMPRREEFKLKAQVSSNQAYEESANAVRRLQQRGEDDRPPQRPKKNQARTRRRAAVRKAKEQAKELAE